MIDLNAKKWEYINDFFNKTFLFYNYSQKQNLIRFKEISMVFLKWKFGDFKNRNLNFVCLGYFMCRD